MRVEGQDPMSAVDPARILGESKALQGQSDNSRFATRLRCENGHQYWMLTEETRAAGKVIPLPCPITEKRATIWSAPRA